jgi:tetratricopeptide (TPR) repeat protein
MRYTKEGLINNGALRPHNSLLLTMHSPLVSWSRVLFITAIIIALIGIIPAVWFPFQLGKVAIFALLALVALVMFVLGRGAHDLMRTHGLRLAALVLLLPLSYLLSSFYSVDKSLSITGLGVEVDTVLFTSLAAMAFLFSFTLFRTLRTVKLLTTVLGWGLLAAVIFQWLLIFFGTSLIPFSIFSDRSVNVIGKWNDLGVLAALLGVFLLAQIELARTTLVRRVVFGAALLGITVLLAIVNFALAWWYLLIAAVALALVAFFTQRSEDVATQQSNPYSYASWSRFVPWVSTVVAVVAVIMLVYGAGINTSITSIFPISSLEVRPSYTSTMNVITAARGGSFERVLIGTGPNTFSNSWITHKPAEVNQSAFWNLDFNVGFSTLETALGTVGLVGALAWLIPALLVLAALVRAMRLSILSREERVTASIAGLGSLMLIGAVILYVPSGSVVLLSFVLSGAAFGFLWRQGRHANEEEPVSNANAMLAWGVVVILVLIGAWGTWGADRRFVAQAITNTGALALQQGNADEALKSAAKAQGIEMIGDNLRLAVDAGGLKIQQIANQKNLSQEQLSQFQLIASSTINTGRMLISKYPNDYRSYVSLARVYDLLATLKVQGASQSAEQTYMDAISHNPQAPDIALALARLEATQGNLNLTQKYLAQSLTLKPNYTDAILMVVQLYVANNDLPNAVKAATAAAQTAPGVAPIWFELGLLYYAGGDTKDAIPPLEKAISIAPDYANAKYFLGLSYYAQKKPQEALAKFEELAKSNPDSTEVNLILGNMRLGKQPFDSAQPPVTNKPVERKTAPISE